MSGRRGALLLPKHRLRPNEAANAAALHRLPVAMKIAIVMPVAEQRGGSEMLLRHFLRAIAETSRPRYCVAFLEDGPMIAEARKLGYGTKLFGAGKLRQLCRAWRTVGKLAIWLRAEQADVVLSWMPKAHLYAAPAALLARIPALWYQQGVTEGLRGRHWIDSLATLWPASNILCASRAVEHAQRRLIPRRRTHVVYPAVDLLAAGGKELPDVRSARRHTGLEPERPVVGIVARLQRQKGVHIFVSAAALLARVSPELRFVVVGGEHPLEPGYLEELRQAAKAGRIEDRITFVGHQVNPLVWLQAMDVVVHASTAPEAFGMVIVEAMSLGKIVIASNVAGPTEIIEDTVDGFLLEPGDPSALAEAITRALTHSQRNTEVRVAAMTKAQQFGTERFAREVEAAVEHFAGGSPTAS